MKQLLSAAMCAAVLVSLLLFPAQAAGAPDTALRAAAQMGIISQNQAGLDLPVKRGEFAKMLVTASPLKGTVSPAANASPYRDVPFTHGCASYIKTAVQKGWLSGYLDGSFRPEKPVTAAEAASGVLALLGYGPDDFSGSYPEGQMALYSSLGLSGGIRAGASDFLTWRDCAALFYNLLDVKMKDGDRSYAEVLGYKLNKDGRADIEAMLHTKTEGPFVVPSSGVNSVLPFTPAAVYRNDAPADIKALQTWDVLYYAKESQTVWAYSRRVSGTLEKVAPSREAPESITVAGVEYKLTGDAVKNQLGVSGGLSIGSVVTLLMGRGGEAAAVYTSADLSTQIIGMVTASGSASYTAANGTGYEAPAITLFGVDGQKYVVRSDKKYNQGSLVRVSFTTEGTKVSSLSRNNAVSGKASHAAGKIGQSPVAADVQIIDITDKTAVKVYFSRLNGVVLSRENVLYSEKNADGEITTLILKAVTGDSYAYGLVRSVQERNEEMDLSGTYRVLVNGQEATYSLSGRLLSAQKGPARFELMDGQLKGIRRLYERKTVDSITGMTLKAGGETHTIWDNASAYVYTDQQYRMVDRNELDPARYNIRAYYDAPDNQGGRVRVLIATPK